MLLAITPTAEASLCNCTVRSLNQTQAGNLGVPSRGQTQGTATQQYDYTSNSSLQLRALYEITKKDILWDYTKQQVSRYKQNYNM